MSQPVKLSDSLVLDARLTGEISERSIAGQIEFWAKLGQAIEPVLEGSRTLALCHAGKDQPLSAVFAAVRSPAGRRKLAEHLKTQPYPHFEATDQKGILVKIEADGERILGRFVNKQFKPIRGRQSKASRKSRGERALQSVG